MEKNQALKMILDKLMEEDKLDMWTIFGEKSGSIMVKMRFQGTMGDNVSDQNSDVMFKRKSDKQIMRDINRLKSSSESENVDKSQIENCDSIEVDSKVQDQGETPCVIEQNECAAAKDSSQSDLNDRPTTEPNAKIVSEMGLSVEVVQPEKAKPEAVHKLRVAKPKYVQQRSSFRRAPSFPHSHPTTPTMNPVDGHEYRCEQCNDSALTLHLYNKSKMAMCRNCSRHDHKDRYICENCFRGSDHDQKRCYMTLIDFT